MTDAELWDRHLDAIHNVEPKDATPEAWQEYRDSFRAYFDADRDAQVDEPEAGA